MKNKKKVNKNLLKLKKLEESILNIHNLIDEEEKRSKVTSLLVEGFEENYNCTHSGSLVIDLISGGGLQPGRWYTYFGKEQSGKSTLLYGIIGTAIENKIPVLFFDYEGSFDPKWFKNITGKNPKEVFGKRDKNTGEWIISPKARHYKPSSGEEGLLLIKNILSKLPDKVKVKDTWYYSFKPTKENLQKYKKVYSKKLRNKTGNLFVPIPNNYGGIELLITIDSYPAMIPKSIADSEKESSAMAQQARMFAQYVGNIRSLLSNKGCTIVGINQLRDRPGVSFGSPEYEPAGNALKHASDVRIKTSTISSPKGSGQIEREGEDEYRYIKVKTTKNKLFIPFKEGITRIWVGHKGESGFGVDKVYEVYSYLKMTGQLTEKKKDLIINIKNKGIKKKYNWNTFKRSIMENKDNLYNICLNQLKTGLANKLLLQQTT